MPAELGLNTGLNNWQETTAEEAVSSYSPCAVSPPWNPKGQAEGFSRDLRIQDRAVGGRRKHACLKQASVNGKESSEYLHDLFHVGAEREPAGSEGQQHCPCQFGQQHQPATGQHITREIQECWTETNSNSHPAAQEHVTPGISHRMNSGVPTCT